MVWGVLWGWHGVWGNLKEKISVRGAISHNGGVSSLVFLAPLTEEKPGSRGQMR